MKTAGKGLDCFHHGEHGIPHLPLKRLMPLCWNTPLHSGGARRSETRLKRLAPELKLRDFTVFLIKFVIFILGLIQHPLDFGVFVPYYPSGIFILENLLLELGFDGFHFRRQLLQ